MGPACSEPLQGCLFSPFRPVQCRLLRALALRYHHKPSTHPVPDQMRLTKPLSLLGSQATCSLALELFHKNKQDFRLPSWSSARDPENQTLCCLRITLTTPTLALHPGSHHPLCIWESQSNGSEVTDRPPACSLRKCVQTRTHAHSGMPGSRSLFHLEPVCEASEHLPGQSEGPSQERDR